MDIRSGTRYEEELLQGVRWARQRVEGGEFYECTFAECSLAETVLAGCRFVSCSFRACDLSLVQVPGTAFSMTRFRDCRMLGVDWTNADWDGIRLGPSISFRGCAISHSTFIGLNLRGTTIRECAAVNVDLREADLREADLRGTDLSESLFLHTDLTGADLRGARNYRISAGQNTLTGARFSLPEALSLLKGLDIMIEDKETASDD